MKKLVAALLIAVLCISFVHADSNATDYRIMINAASRTLKLFKSGTMVKEFPIAVGKPTTKSPVGSFRIINKVINPWWNNHGNPVAPGPKNPLGIRWMGISAPGGTYGIHGNSTPASIGTFASGGCIRMFNSDVEWLFSIVPIGTPVQIVYENLELKLDKYTNAPVLIAYPNMYKQKTAEALVKKLNADNAISEQQTTKALKLANSNIKNVTAVSEGTPLLLNNQFVTSDAFIENGEAYVNHLAASDCFGLDSKLIDSLSIKTLVKNDRVYINMTDAASKLGGKLQYDKNYNNIYFTASLIKINGRFLCSYSGSFDREYKLSPTVLQGIDGEILPAFNNQAVINLKDYSQEKKWSLNADSLFKIMNIDIPLRVKVGDSYLSTVSWDGRYYLKYDDCALIPGIENQAINIYDYNNVKYIDLYELIKGYEYKEDFFLTVVELIKPLEADKDEEADIKNAVE